MSSGASNHKRLLKLQRHILLSIRAEVRKTLVNQSPTIRRYYEAYKREFRVPMKSSNKTELLKACVKADIIVMGDYHPFPQSQKAALRLMRELITKRKFTIALEMFPATTQKALDAFMEGGITEAAFLEKIDYETIWGFPWKNFKPLLDFARTHGLKVLALNLDSASLEARDVHAAEIIAEHFAASDREKVFVLFGDLHVARGHLPQKLKRNLKEAGQPARILSIFQNSESLYWRMAAQMMEQTVDVVRLARDRFCIMNAAPWVKLQSYLQWAETGDTIDSDDVEFIDQSSGSLLEQAHDRLKNLADVLGLPLSEKLEFNIQTLKDLEAVQDPPSIAALTKTERHIFRYHVIGSRTIYLRKQNTLYLPTMGINSVCEGVAKILHATLSKTDPFFDVPKEQFFAAVMSAAITYFGSKVLNHRRKCDLIEDYRQLLERGLRKRALPGEKRARLVAKNILSHTETQQEYLSKGKYKGRLLLPTASRRAVFLETAHGLGSILGEKLYTAFVGGSLPADKVKKLFKTNLDENKVAKALYLQTLTDLADVKLSRTSKRSWL